MPDPARVPLTAQRLSEHERDLGKRRIELQRRRVRGELCGACATDKPQLCTNEGTQCPVDSEGDR